MVLVIKLSAILFILGAAAITSVVALPIPCNKLKPRLIFKKPSPFTSNNGNILGNSNNPTAQLGAQLLQVKSSDNHGSCNNQSKKGKPDQSSKKKNTRKKNKKVA